MGLFIGVAAAAIAISISIKYIGSSRAIGLDRGAMFKVQTKVITCTHCQTRVKRQRYGQQCPNCRKYF